MATKRNIYYIEILNQINDENHYSNDALFDIKLSEKVLKEF